MKDINRYIDHTFLKATATPKDIVKLCNEAKEYNFYAVCINSCYVSLAANELQNSGVKVASVVGFPLGSNNTRSKVCEAEQCIKDGADEIDIVLNIGLLKAKMHKSVGEEISAVKEAIGNRILKVILETCYLTDNEIRIGCQIAKQAGANYVKTSTGFGTGGATEHAVKIMVDEVGDTLKIKASGGIKDTATAKRYIEMGVSRIGTSSGIEIVTSLIKDTDEHTY